MTGETGVRIVATVGPSSRGLVTALREAGATAIRLNASHVLVDELAAEAAAIRRALPDCPLIIDLQGAKMRLGACAEREVSAGERIRFALAPSRGEIPLPHREIYDAVSAGDTLACDDARLLFRVADVFSGALEAVALVDGTIRPRKGVNVIEHPICPSDLSEFDQACIRAAAGLRDVGFAYSFMKNGDEAEWIRRRAPGSLVIGKVERRAATDNVRRIANAVDELWICRGDLGAQLGPAGLAAWVARYDPRRAPCPVLMAGQVLEHLTSHAEPTRSEVCHLFDLVSRGYSGFVLSDETAVGSDPAGAVRILRSLLTAFAKA